MTETIIIGGGVAGLTAAFHLQEERIPHVLLEASDRVGGRIKTDIVDGCKLDRGFQVFLTQYPEAKNLLDYHALGLHFFRPGAVILTAEGDKEWIGDPIRDFKALYPTLTSNVGTLKDKFKLLRLRSKLRGQSVESIFAKTEMSTQAGLECLGFSQRMISSFFTPFYRGIFLEDDLSTSRRMFEFVFKMFSEGFACLPDEGMEAIPKHIASKLSRHDIKLNAEVVNIEDQAVQLKDGASIGFKNLIIATDGVSSARLCDEVVSTDFRSTKNMYFKADETSVNPQLISLLPDGIVNNICDVSTVADSYTNDDSHLISVSIRSGREASPESVIQEMAKWYPEAFSWKHLKTYNINYALPDQSEVNMHEIRTSKQGFIVCGDHTMNGSLNAAIKSGRLAAEKIIKSNA